MLTSPCDVLKNVEFIFAFDPSFLSARLIIIKLCKTHKIKSYSHVYWQTLLFNSTTEFQVIACEHTDLFKYCLTAVQGKFKLFVAAREKHLHNCFPCRLQVTAVASGALVFSQCQILGRFSWFTKFCFVFFHSGCCC